MTNSFLSGCIASLAADTTFTEFELLHFVAAKRTFTAALQIGEFFVVVYLFVFGWRIIGGGFAAMFSPKKLSLILGGTINYMQL